MIRLRCPFCQTRLKVPQAKAGKRGRCPGCRQKVQIPAVRMEAGAETLEEIEDDAEELEEVEDVVVLEPHEDIPELEVATPMGRSQRRRPRPSGHSFEALGRGDEWPQERDERTPIARRIWGVVGVALGSLIVLFGICSGGSGGGSSGAWQAGQMAGLATGVLLLLSGLYCLFTG